MELKLNEHKISVRVKVGNYVKYLAKDVVIKSVRDMRLKIRYDLSLKNLAEDETKELIKKYEDRSEDIRDRDANPMKVYNETLNRL